MKLRPFGLLALALLALASLSIAAERGPAVPDYPFQEVAAGVFVIQGPIAYPSPENQGFMNNPAWVVTDAGVVVIDPGASVQSGEMVLRALRKVTDAPIIAVLNTHVHGDHWLGNQAIRAAYPDVPIYAHPNMIEAIEDGAGEQWLDLMLRATEGATAGTEAVGPTQAVGGDTELQLGGLTYRIHHWGQAHTNNDLMIEIPERAVLFAADNANNQRIVRLDDASFAGLIDTLERAKALSVEVVVPGHGPTGGPEIIEENLVYVATLRQAVAELFDEGMSDFEMKDPIAERLSAYQDWAGFDDELGKHISLAYLEVEADAF
ncbi:MBL fold metallo-hydrolase [Lamprobacter modestohalophilus]|uniref:MBL fold metallo-hydrolase n=1 Tax=Lamprobacter modestohalophilus TaxID=1064514 RepID=UPI002ADEF8D9|nr:MBL fold metallo-hydrolase [Lamprobacter modestohalophilus]MEA1051253.1 MBL fold metallo-hydrolase [Lamprobacter modestohalophilus]